MNEHCYIACGDENVDEVSGILYRSKKDNKEPSVAAITDEHIMPLFALISISAANVMSSSIPSSDLPSC